MKQGIITDFIVYLGKKIERKRFTESPIYIGGCGRSGTTLLLSILSSHNDIFACPRELNLFEDAEVVNGNLETPKFYRLYRTFLQKRIKKSAKRYCEKSPLNIRKFEFIDRIHEGNFKMIHIIRDGRDVILSKHPRNNKEYWVSPERWISDVSFGLKFKDHTCMYTLHYEDLVNNFESSIRALCDFLEIDQSDEILKWHSHTTVRENNALHNPISDIYNSSIEKWKRPENEERAKELSSIPDAISLLKELNYPV